MPNWPIRFVATSLSLVFGLAAGNRAAWAADPVASGSPAQARWALSTNTTLNSVTVYAIADGTGELSLHSMVSADGGPGAVAVHPSGRFAFVASIGTQTVQAFAIDRAAGTLTAVGSVAVPGAASHPFGIAVDPLGRFVYVTSTGSSTLAGYWIHPLTGRLSPLPGFPVATGLSPHEIVFDRFGRHAFVSNWGAGTISAYHVGWNGRLTPVAGSPFATTPHPEGLAVHPTGRVLYAAHGDNGRVSAFVIGADGALAPAEGSPFPVGLDPFGVACSRDGRTLYVSEPALESVQMRRIDQTTGGLVAMSPSYVPAGNNVRTIRVDPSGRFLYVAAVFPSAIFAYAIDHNGVLTPLAGSPYMTDSGLEGLALVR
jgi:DNA-binding beta-propeller fold protein YncE